MIDLRVRLGAREGQGAVADVWPDVRSSRRSRCSVGTKPAAKKGEGEMRKVITAVAAGASALVLAGTGVAWASGVAHADDTSMLITSACLTLNQYHSVAGVVGVVDYLEHDMGMTQYESGQMLAKIVAQCPSNRGVVEAFLDLDKEGMLPR